MSHRRDQNFGSLGDVSCPQTIKAEGLPDPEPWCVYLVRRADNALYTGIATDVERRFAEHCEGRGAKALRGRGPLQLLSFSPAGDRSLAQRVEARIKRLSKTEKERLATSRGALTGFIRAVADGRTGEDDT